MCVLRALAALPGRNVLSCTMHVKQQASRLMPLGSKRERDNGTEAVGVFVIPSDCVVVVACGWISVLYARVI